jgi:hypothetical protein
MTIIENTMIDSRLRGNEKQDSLLKTLTADR